MAWTDLDCYLNAWQSSTEESIKWIPTNGLNREVETGTPTFPLNPGVMPIHFGKIELKI